MCRIIYKLEVLIFCYHYELTKTIPHHLHVIVYANNRVKKFGDFCADMQLPTAETTVFRGARNFKPSQGICFLLQNLQFSV